MEVATAHDARQYRKAVFTADPHDVGRSRGLLHAPRGLFGKTCRCAAEVPLAAMEATPSKIRKHTIPPIGVVAVKCTTDL